MATCYCSNKIKRNVFGLDAAFFKKHCDHAELLAIIDQYHLLLFGKVLQL